MTFPRAVFLKNFRWVTTASVLGLLRMVISTMTEGAEARDPPPRKAKACDPIRPAKELKSRDDISAFGTFCVPLY